MQKNLLCIRVNNSMLTNEEKKLLFELITNEQLKYLIPKDQYNTNKYNALEALKVKLRNK